MIKDAFALPKSTDEEKEVRKQAVRDAAYQAALVPKTTAIIIRESTSLYAVSRVLPIRPAFQTSCERQVSVGIGSKGLCFKHPG